MNPDHFLFAVPPEEEPTCPGCGGSTRYPCICDYFADPNDQAEDDTPWAA